MTSWWSFLSPNVFSEAEIGLGCDRRLRVILALQKVLGCCPLSRDPTRENIVFTFDPSTPASSFYAVSAIFFIIFWVVYSTHVGLEYFFLFDSRVRSVLYSFQNALIQDPNLKGIRLDGVFASINGTILLMSFFQIGAIVIGFLCRSDLLKFLNYWTKLQSVYSTTFKIGARTYQKNYLVAKPRCVSRSSLLLFSYVLGTGLLPPLFFIGIVVSRGGSWAEAALFGIGLFHYGMVETLEDAKNILVYSSLSKAYSKIRQKIQKGLLWEDVTVAQVQSWRQLTAQMQTMVKLGVRALAPSQLAFLANSLLFGTLCIYLSIHGSISSPLSFLISFLAGSYFFQILGRLFVKAIVAERIIKEERMMAGNIAQLDSIRYSEDVLEQVFMLRDMLTRRQSRINFNGYVTLSRKLFFGILTQVVTYLLVLLQFSHSHPPKINF